MTTSANFQLAHFLKSAPDLTHCPSDDGCEVAFAGRSNAGKSSCINTLTGIGGLARTSKTPGRTQLINFFALRTDAQRLVDLPGYGYAKVSRDIKNEWQKNLGDYLQERESLRGLVLIMDIRHPLKDYDLNMLEWARAAQLPVHMVLTKADKLNRGPAANTLQKALRDTGDGALVTGQTFSSLRKEGIDELRLKLGSWLSEHSSGERA